MGLIPADRALAELAAILEAADIPDPRREARLLLAFALGCEPATLFTHESVPATAGHAEAARRASREPLAYITGRREFWSLALEVTPATLIPRPDSESLIEAALHHCPDRARIATILDLGTGTGALLLAALREFPAAFGIGTDRATEAVSLARRNASRHALTHRSAFLVADWSAPLSGRFDLILANPPYIPTANIATLMAEVAAHEPRSALDGGTDGLDAYRAIIADLPRLLAPGGVAILEAGIDQDAAITDLATRCGLVATSHNDLAGVPRAIVLQAAPPAPEKTVW